MYYYVIYYFFCKVCCTCYCVQALVDSLVFCIILPFLYHFRSCFPKNDMQNQIRFLFFASITAPALSFTPSFLYVCAI